MENEILGQILAELKTLNTRHGNMEEKISNIELRQNGMAEELMAFQEFTMQKFDKLERRFDGLERRFDGLEARFDGLENEQRMLHLTIEHEIKPSIQLLAEGHLQMQEQLDRIEGKVTSHDEIIFKRVK